MHQVPSVCYRVCEWVVCDTALNPGQVCNVFEGPCTVWFTQFSTAASFTGFKLYMHSIMQNTLWSGLVVNVLDSINAVS